MVKEKDLMLTKEQIQEAIDESQKVKEKYPAFWKFYEMLLEMNQGLLQLQEQVKKK
jgi:hypothetical protein